MSFPGAEDPMILKDLLQSGMDHYLQKVALVKVRKVTKLSILKSWQTLKNF
jgi:hypothetical protein